MPDICMGKTHFSGSLCRHCWDCYLCKSLHFLQLSIGKTEIRLKFLRFQRSTVLFWFKMWNQWMERIKRNPYVKVKTCGNAEKLVNLNLCVSIFIGYRNDENEQQSLINVVSYSTINVQRIEVEDWKISVS